MTATGALQAALDELYAESAEVQLRLEAVAVELQRYREAANVRSAELNAELERLAAARAAVEAVLADTTLLTTDPPRPILVPTPDVPLPPAVLPKRDEPERPAADEAFPDSAIRTTPTGGRARRAKYDRAEVARVCREAYEHDRPMTAAVEAHFGISTGSASQLIAAARAEGHHMPPKRRGGPGPAPSLPAPAADLSPASSAGNDNAVVLRCDDCEWTGPVDRPMRLLGHCSVEHHRRPSRAERTPRTAEEAA